MALFGQEVIAELRTKGPGHSESLIPSLNWLLSSVKLSLKDVSAVAFSAGPGAFTGLRVGLSTAKGLSFSEDIPLVMVPTLDAIAYRMAFCKENLCVLLDARRKEVYASIYDVSDGSPESLYGPKALSVWTEGFCLPAGMNDERVVLREERPDEEARFAASRPDLRRGPFRLRGLVLDREPPLPHRGLRGDMELPDASNLRPRRLDDVEDDEVPSAEPDEFSDPEAAL